MSSIALNVIKYRAQTYSILNNKVCTNDTKEILILRSKFTFILPLANQQKRHWKVFLFLHRESIVYNLLNLKEVHT